MANNYLLKIGRQLTKAGQALMYGATGGRGALAIRGEISGADLGGLNLKDHRVNSQSLYTIYRSHADVFSCIRELHQGVGVAGYEWEDLKDSSKVPNMKSVQVIESLINSRTGRFTFRKFKDEIIRHGGISGNAYVFIEKSVTGKILDLDIIDPRSMYVVTDKYGVVLYWIQKVKNDTQRFEPDEIAHFVFTKDPDSPVFGLSPIEPIVWDVRTDMAAMVSNYVFFENDAIPAAHYILNDDIGEKEQARAIQELERQIKGAEKRHKSIAVSGIKEIKTLAISNKDMEFHVLRRFTTEKVCSAYGVPKSILNYTDGVNYSNGKEQTEKFWEGTIEPLEKQFAEFINKTLLPLLGIDDIQLVFNPRSFDNREWNEASSREDVKQGILTINEARELRGKEPYDPKLVGEFVDKPVIWAGAGVRPLEDIGVDLADVDPSSIDGAQKSIELIDNMINRHNYGRRDPQAVQNSKSVR